MAKQPEMKYKLVVVVRQDLRLTPGKLAVQVAHAAVSCALKAKAHVKAKKWFNDWFHEGQKKVVVKTKVLEDLYELKTIAEGQGLTTAMISDAGLTEIPPGTVTCLGVGPGPAATVDAVTGALSLY